MYRLRVRASASKKTSTRTQLQSQSSVVRNGSTFGILDGAAGEPFDPSLDRITTCDAKSDRVDDNAALRNASEHDLNELTFTPNCVVV